MRDSKVFINSYHFIPLPSKKSLYQQKIGEALFTGKLDYVLETKTPLFIPNTSNDHTFRPIKQTVINEKGEEEEKEQPEEHLSYDFFSYKNLEEGKYYDEEWAVPVIPGSEVRGMFRSVYETLTGSCLSAINRKEETLSKRTMEYNKPGLLSFKKGQLYVAEARCYSYDMNKSGNYLEGEEVSFYVKKNAKGEFTTKAIISDTGRKNGYILKGKEGPSKKSYHIFECNYKKEITYVTETDIKRLKDVLKSYEAQKNVVYEEYANKLEQFLENKKEDSCFPAYFSKVASSIYLAPACVTRESYTNTVQDMIKDFQPCDKKDNVCPACKLFGMIGEKNTDSIASKLRFSDLRFVGQEEDVKKCYTKVTTIPALGQPKLSNTEFYLKYQEGATLQTFDYYIKDGKVIPYTPEIAGRKFYWHHQITELPEASQRTNLNKTIRAVRPEQEFQGTVYFDKITETQLKQLVWMLNMSANISGKGYKLGMGKPLGMGSVTVHIKDEGSCLRKMALQNGKIVYDMSQKPLNGKYDSSYEEVEFLEEVEKEFLFMADLNATDGWTVSYPYVNPNEAEDKGYEWYTANHSSLDRNSPRKRVKMLTLEHLKGFEEVNTNDYKIDDFSLPVKPGKSTTNCVWIAGYKLDNRQEEKLKGLLPEKTQIDKEKVWLKLEDIPKYADKYNIIALPSNTKTFLVEEVKKYFKEVYIAVKVDSKYDNEWKKM